VWIAEYVLAGYGTGAIMAVPSGDERDHAFAKNFEIPVTNIFGEKYTGENAYSEKIGTIENSGYLSGMSIAEAAETAIDTLVKIEAGKRRVNYRLRDAGFSRQRYWGEPFPIVYVNDVPYGVDENNATEVLPVTLPHVDSYKPGPEGKGPLANLEDWVQSAAGERETNTMPGYAGSSWYFLRYMDPHNDTEFAGRAATDYWQQVDLYVGGTEHAVGHLLYSRMWTKALYDLGHIGFDEPFKKLLNQGMIQGSSRFVFEVTVNKLVTNRRGRIFVSKSQYINLKKIENDILKTIEFLNEIGIDSVSVENIREDSKISIIRHHVDVNLVDGVLLNIPLFKELFNINTDSGYLLTEDDGTYICDAEVEKMSKSKYNVVNPDKIVEQYGADTFRLYEMFLGPVDVSKPWDTKGIEGVHRFLKKLWRLYADEQSGWIINYDAPTEGELRILHKTIKKVHEDIERFSFNTSVSQFMICVNELTSLGCHKRAILEPLTILLTAFAPHIAEELWQEGLQNKTTVLDASFPDYDEQLIAESSITYGVSVNGKKRTEMSFAATAEQAEVETAVLADATVQKWMEDKPLKKFIFVKGKMINVVV
jgi:leucyl-tRNA synthetase